MHTDKIVYGNEVKSRQLASNGSHERVAVTDTDTTAPMALSLARLGSQLKRHRQWLTGKVPFQRQLQWQYSSTLICSFICMINIYS